jgi:hypothetical protein
MLAKIEFHEIDSWNLEATPEMYATIIQGIDVINSRLCICMLFWAKKQFLKLKRLQYRGSRIMQSTPNNSLGVLSVVSSLAERCVYLNYRYLVAAFDKHGHLLRERFESLNWLNSERCMKEFALVGQFTFQPSRTYAQYDLAALVPVPDIDKTIMDALALVDKGTNAIVTSRELAKITSDYATRKHFFIQMDL